MLRLLPILSKNFWRGFTLRSNVSSFFTFSIPYIKIQLLQREPTDAHSLSELL
jgi:hypothetical protein